MCGSFYLLLLLFFFYSTACVGSVGISMAYIACPITGMSVQRWGCRFTAMIGALVCAIGLLASSFVQKMFFLYFTYSLLFGLGVSCIFMACYIVVARNFEKRRSLATGFVASGAALGVLVIAPIKQILLDSIGWRIIYRMMAAAFAGVFFLAAAVFTEPKTWNANENHLKTEPRRKNRQPLKRNKLLDLSVCKVPEFVILTLSVAVECFGLYIPQIHLVSVPLDSLLKLPRRPSRLRSQLFCFFFFHSCDFTNCLSIYTIMKS